MKLAERIFRRTDYKITSPFGNRIHPITKKPSFHYGCDYGTHVQNWNQYALENGEVIEVRIGCTDKDGNGYGNYVKVKYPRINIQLLHAHLKQVNVKKGQAVNKDTVLGLTGTTGNSTGVHLHLGMRYVGSTKYYDPHLYDYQEYSAPVNPLKSIDEIAKEVIAGKWKNQPERKKSLEAAGYNYSEVQARVNEILKGNQTSVEDKYYTVVSGDNLTKIANRFGTTWQKIYENNKLLIDDNARRHGVKEKFYNYIYPGQKLVIK